MRRWTKKRSQMLLRHNFIKGNKWHLFAAMENEREKSLMERGFVSEMEEERSVHGEKAVCSVVLLLLLLAVESHTREVISENKRRKGRELWRQTRGWFR